MWLPQTLASVPPAAPDVLATQQAALSVPGQLQQQQLPPQQAAIIEEQPPPALEGAGLPPQDGKCGNEFKLGYLRQFSHANTSHIIYFTLLLSWLRPLKKTTCL